MSIFSRLTDIVNANINALLDRAEEPEKMVRLMIQEMEDTLVEVRSRAVKAIADQKALERRIDRLGDAESEWERKAEFALRRGREDLATAALLAKRQASERVKLLHRELVVIQEGLDKHNVDLQQLQAKLDEAKARKKSLEIRMQNAKDRTRVKQAVHDSRVDDALARYESLERRIDELEAGAEVFELGREKSLAEAFAELEAGADVAEEMAELKARVAGVER